MSERTPDDTPDDATVERLRAAFRAGETETQGGEPVDADRIWRAVSGELPPEERREVVARVAADPAWAAAWRLAHELTRSASEATALAERAPPPDTRARRDTERPRPQGRRFHFAWSRPVWGALATAALVLVVVGVSVQQGTDGPPVVRGGDTVAVASQVPEDAPLPRERAVLRWSGGPEGTRWSVQVSSEDLSLVHRADSLTRSEYAVPAEVLAAVKPGTKLLWQVEARLPDGQVLRSATFVNRIE
ncbi:hypothetical protein [Pyxidicoccus xibeiensis]|uniref:hypothetical protein n=1 Tax=Pyxidicoccus xibeiensis TaxID=2906759 RepID=UPI0020A72499|nr:hypothetical protein [Pyxidicoccus xibeiensis]MCP3138731.1 hypothetical protein [Pyxidicoccus xibeiensis]